MLVRYHVQWSNPAAQAAKAPCCVAPEVRVLAATSVGGRTGSATIAGSVGASVLRCWAHLWQERCAQD